MTAAELATKLGGKKVGRGYMALCPAHDDHTPSLSIIDSDDEVLVHCHAGCSQEAVIQVLRDFGYWEEKPRRKARARAASKRGGGAPVRRSKRASVHQVPPTDRGEKGGLTLTLYAEAKGLPMQWLRDLGLSDIMLQGEAAVRMAYRDGEGAEVSVRFRLSLTGGNRFRYKGGSKPSPYGLWRLEQARAAGYVVLGEGESDAHTL
jgi:hypothetical protein